VTIYVDDWAAAYGSPYLVHSDDVGSEAAILVEDGEVLATHVGRAAQAGDAPLALVDGVRRGEASLWLDADGVPARGVAGSHACGGVLAPHDGPCVFGPESVRRLVIFGSGQVAGLPPTAGGFAWEARSIADPAPDAPLRELQARMRRAEGTLAERLCSDGYLTVIDGPLNYVRSRDLPVVGYVKTHHRALLAPEHHGRIPRLAAGERTSLFQLGEDRYSTYVRLAAAPATASPWAGIIRLEVPQSSGLSAAVDVVDRVTGAICRYAGVPHRDPRAPQNLQPIGALERRLRHLLGDARLAARAVREAVQALATADPTRGAPRR
jgi:hypothetical protein